LSSLTLENKEGYINSTVQIKEVIEYSSSNFKILKRNMESVFKMRNEDQKLIVKKEKEVCYVCESAFFPFPLKYLKEF